LDQKVKEEQYKDMIREAEQYRLIKAVAQPDPRRPQGVVATLREVMDGLNWHLPSARPADRAQV
jgi:hypothetical protein